MANFLTRHPTVTIEVYLIPYLNLKFLFKTQISFFGLYGPKTRRFFLTNREDGPNVGPCFLITHSCFSGFFYSHKEHPRVNILTERYPPASSGDTEPIRCVNN